MKLKSNSACEAWLGLNKMMGCVIKRQDLLLWALLLNFTPSVTSMSFLENVNGLFFPVLT